MFTPDQERTNGITEKIIGAAHTVANVRGCGFLEQVYENALAHQLTKAELKAEPQKPIDVWYDGVRVDEYFADSLVAECVLVERKAVKAFDELHRAQCLNYLKATGLKVCLLINFGSPRVEVKRIVHRC